MNDAQRLAALRIVLIVVGLITLFAVWPLMILWPSGWTWHSGHSDYPLMIVGIYATLGVFLLKASRDPMKHLSLIWFTVWSSVVHGAIMAVQSFGMEMDGMQHFGRPSRRCACAVYHRGGAGFLDAARRQSALARTHDALA